MGVEFRIEVLAAGHTNEATCLRLTHDSISILLDAGLTVAPSREFDLPDDPPALALITHAHLGHGGGLLAATLAWPETIFWGPPPTFQILSIQFHHANNHLGVSKPLPDRRRWIEVPFGQTTTIHTEPDISVTFWPCGHMCGASLPVINWANCRIAYWVDWTAYPYGGNLGLVRTAVSNCDLVIAHLPDDPVLFSNSGTPISHILGGAAQTVLIAAQPIGAAQQILAEVLALPQLHCRWTLHIEAFTYAVSQHSPELATALKMFDWHEGVIGTCWLSSSTNTLPSKRNLFIGGSACLWPSSPSFEIARQWMDDSQTLICLGDDVVPQSPAHYLWQMRDPQMIGTHVDDSVRAKFRKMWGMDTPRCAVQKLALLPRKMSPRHTLEWIRAVRPRHLMVFGENNHLAFGLDDDIFLTILDEGDTRTVALPTVFPR